MRLRRLVAGLQGDDHLPGAVGELGVRVETRTGRRVEGFQVAEFRRCGALAGAAQVRQVREQHAELGAPIADVVLADDFMAQRFQYARHGVADDRAAQVADMHLLGEVRRGVVHDDLVGASCALDAWRREALSNERRCQGDVDEAGAGNFNALRNVLHTIGLKRGHHRLGHVAWLAAGPLRGGHRAVCLVVAVLGAPGRPQRRLRGVEAGGGEGACEALGQRGAQVHRLSRRPAPPARLASPCCGTPARRTPGRLP